MTGELRPRRCVGGGRRGAGIQVSSGGGEWVRGRVWVPPSPPSVCSRLLYLTTSSACTLLYIMPFRCPQILNIIYVYPRRTQLALDPQATLKKMLFLVQRPGYYITVEWELFFLHFGHPLDRKQTFFKGGLRDLVMEVGVS